MPLSEYEQRVPEQMSRQLVFDDPKLATTMTEPLPSRSLRRILITAAGVLVGAAILVTGAVTGLPVVGVVGFVVMFGAVMYGFSAEKPAAVSEPEKTAAASDWQDMFNKRWDDRQSG